MTETWAAILPQVTFRTEAMEQDGGTEREKVSIFNDPDSLPILKLLLLKRESYLVKLLS